jgi:hypothetical protein
MKRNAEPKIEKGEVSRGMSYLSRYLLSQFTPFGSAKKATTGGHEGSISRTTKGCKVCQDSLSFSAKGLVDAFVDHTELLIPIPSGEPIS